MRTTDDVLSRLHSAIASVPDFPSPGVLFRDITPLLADPALFGLAVAKLADPVREAQVTHVVAIESRGFILGAPVALALDAAFVPLRKPGKLPRATHRVGYALEYGEDALELHRDALTPKSRVLIVDDVLATGGTLAAAATLVRTAGARLVGAHVLIELDALGGRARVGDLPVRSVLRY
ncbi:MAG: adenine phosphoribosyltransferase [Gemmatimonadaceae bacterium]|jgi:adenine phosphoribosyltransferase|nr:adenine phosphoribosyltransferase [Gemmatimonadaceae bacterium]